MNHLLDRDFINDSLVEDKVDWLDDWLFADRWDELEDQLLSISIPKPKPSCPVAMDIPKPGCFYRIQAGKGGLITTATKAYGNDLAPPGSNQRLKFARKINGHPYNRRFWVKGGWPFKNGQISFNPRFASTFNEQAKATKKSPRGHSFAVIWIPPLKDSKKDPKPIKKYPKPDFIKISRRSSKDWTSKEKEYVEFTALPAAFDMLEEAIRMISSIRDAGSGKWECAWDSTPAKRWFGNWSKRRMDRVHLYLTKALKKINTHKLNFIRWKNSKNNARTFLGSSRIWLADSFFNCQEQYTCPLPPPITVNITCKIQTGSIIVHELIHTIGLTRIIEKYGRKAVRLAGRNPGLATINSENYQGFVAEAYMKKVHISEPKEWKECWICNFIDRVN